MVKEALATKYRPKTFQDVVEQSSQVKILEHQIKQKHLKLLSIFWKKWKWKDNSCSYYGK
jgi:replication-associated recombination protein RarA